MRSEILFPNLARRTIAKVLVGGAIGVVAASMSPTEVSYALVTAPANPSAGLAFNPCGDHVTPGAWDVPLDSLVHAETTGTPNFVALSSSQVFRAG